MPGGDRTGPLGAGPMTGRGAGWCAGYAAPGFTNPGFGPGRGRRRGFAGGGGFGRGGGFGGGRGFAGGGRGAGRGFWRAGLPAAAVQPDERQVLESEVQALRQELAALESRLQSLTEMPPENNGSEK